MEYKIFLEKVESTKNWPKTINEGYYGPVSGVSMNHAIYSRVDKDSAYKFNRRDAIVNVRKFLHAGYRAKCVPPITVVY